MNNVVVRWVLLALSPLMFADPPRYEQRGDHDPDGSGKFYMGREIALVMGHEAAGWLDRPEREEEEKPSKLLELLAIKPGQVVADVGAGSGYHALRIAKTVGDKGRVYAVDIQEEMLAMIAERAKKSKLANVEGVLGKIDDPKLPEGRVDLVILVDVYHEFSHPYEMMEGIVKSLKPGGRVAFAEYRAEDERVPIKQVHKMSERQVIREMEPFPLKHVKTHGELPWQHLIVFEKKKELPFEK
jgi:ubiquinone/menaquinone biosynthesis C-methylase UbiE